MAKKYKTLTEKWAAEDAAKAAAKRKAAPAKNEPPKSLREKLKARMKKFD